MSFNFIHDFQIRIHRLLSLDEKIRLSVDRIYVAVVQDAKYPFLLINVLKTEDVSKFDLNMYNVEFEIAAFARDKNQGVLISLLEMVTNKLTSVSCNFDDYKISGIKSGEINFVHSQDLLTTKLSIMYKILLQKKDKL